MTFLGRSSGKHYFVRSSHLFMGSDNGTHSPSKRTYTNLLSHLKGLVFSEKFLDTGEKSWCQLPECNLRFHF